MLGIDKRRRVPRDFSSRRIIVVLVPPVDELDLVGPLQVFNSVNRLADRKIYAIEVVTNGNCPTVEGEGGVLTFVARQHFDKVEGPSDEIREIHFGVHCPLCGAICEIDWPSNRPFKIVAN